MIQMAVRTHYDNILKIERENNRTSSAWLQKSKFDLSVDNKTVVIVCGPDENTVDGYAVYRFDKKNKVIDVLKLEGTDSSLYEMGKYIEKRAKDFMYNEIFLSVHERRLEYQKTIHALGWEAVGVERNVYKDGDAFRFRSQSFSLD